jgi:hypothetical protein
MKGLTLATKVAPLYSYAFCGHTRNLNNEKKKNRKRDRKIRDVTDEPTANSYFRNVHIPDTLERRNTIRRAVHPCSLLVNILTLSQCPIDNMIFRRHLPKFREVHSINNDKFRNVACM